jgi:MIP family channel proteins
VSKSLQAWAGELVGTFIFVTIICASVILTTGAVGDTGLVGIGLAHAFGLGATITAFAAISGAHFNPAVTLSAWIGRKISSADALGYVACQVLGALGAAIFLRVAFTEAQWQASSLATPALSVSTGKGLLIEAVLTFFLVTVVWGTGIDERSPRVGGFAIGSVLGAMILAFGPLTGVGLNPARYLGPAAVSSNLDDWWVYILGPVIGGGVAGIMYQYLWWGGFPWARIGGSPADAPDTVSPMPASSVLEEAEAAPVVAPVRRAPVRKARARKTVARKPAPRKR